MMDTVTVRNILVSFQEYICVISACGWCYYGRTAFSWCSVTSNVIHKLKRTAPTIRRSTYVVFTPPQLSWLPNPIAMLRCFLRRASLLLFRLQLHCCNILEWFASSSNFCTAALPKDVSFRTVGKKEWLFICRANDVSCIYANIKFAFLRYLNMSVWLRTVGKKEGLFICRAKHVVWCISVR